MGKRKRFRRKMVKLEFEYGKLLVNALKHENEMRKEAMKLDKKRKRNYVV